MDETEEISRLRCIFLPCHETLNEDILSAEVRMLTIAIEKCLPSLPFIPEAHERVEKRLQKNNMQLSRHIEEG